MVRINEEPEVKQYDNRFSDLNYSSHDASAMMVHAPNINQVNGITIIKAPTKDGYHFGTTVLIDTGFTGHAIMSHSVATMLGYEFEPIQNEGFITTMGLMNTNFQWDSPATPESSQDIHCNICDCSKRIRRLWIQRHYGN